MPYAVALGKVVGTTDPARGRAKALTVVLRGWSPRPPCRAGSWRRERSCGSVPCSRHCGEQQRDEQDTTALGHGAIL